jgi:hypothetical protein
MSIIRTSTVTAAAFAAGVTLASAQTTQDHTAHHPGGQTPAQAQPMQRQAGPQMPMQGQAGGMGMMGGNMAQMMAMMQMMRGGMMMPMDMMGPAGMASHIEGRIAFLKAELKITDAQTPQWNAFADAVRDSAKTLHTAMQSMMQASGSVSAPDQIERRITLMSSHLDAAKALLVAMKPLYAVLSDEQKKTADELMSEHLMGMRPASMGMQQRSGS